MQLTQKYLDELTYELVGAAIEVHKTLGSGLLESVYHFCMKEELSLRGINFESEFKIPLVYKGRSLEADFRCDLFVESCFVVELKSVQEMHPVFESQILTYMNLLQVPKGILINFTCSNIFKSGQQTFVNEIYRQLPFN